MNENTELITTRARRTRSMQDFVKRYFAFNYPLSILVSVFLITGNTLGITKSSTTVEYTAHAWIYLRSAQIAYASISYIRGKDVNTTCYPSFFLMTEIIGALISFVSGHAIGVYNFIIINIILTFDALFFVVFFLFYVNGERDAPEIQQQQTRLQVVPSSVVVLAKDETDECTICLESYNDGDSIRILCCRHRYHRSCIDTWHQHNDYCPLCRTQSR
jgi:hypothetical protein